MKKKTKIRMLVIMPAVVSTLLVGGIVTFLLTSVRGNANDMAAQSPQAGESSAMTGTENITASESNPGAAAAGESDPATPSVPQPAACDFSAWTGKPVDESAVKASGRPYRILKPGDMVTQDFSPDRINVEINEQGIVTAVHCD